VEVVWYASSSFHCSNFGCWVSDAFMEMDWFRIPLEVSGRPLRILSTILLFLISFDCNFLTIGLLFLDPLVAFVFRFEFGPHQFEEEFLFLCYFKFLDPHQWYVPFFDFHFHPFQKSFRDHCGFPCFHFSFYHSSDSCSVGCLSIYEFKVAFLGEYRWTERGALF
jgi:hypothetical protein